MRLRGARIAVATPAPPGSASGNRVTAERWARRLGEAGADARVLVAWDGEPADALIALHAAKSLPSILRWLERRPGAPLVVGLAGTDVYGALRAGPDAAPALAALARADRIVALQPLAADALPAPLRGRVRVIEQSAERVEGAPREPGFLALVLAHLRAVKDPLLPARAARLLPPGSRVRIELAGRALDAALASAARAEEGPRFRWIGELAHRDALARLASADLLIVPSREEGGANVIGEAAVAGVAILAAANDGAIGLLGRDHPGLFPPGDAAALAAALARAEREPGFLPELRARSAALAPLFAPDRERAAWEALFAELG